MAGGKNIILGSVVLLFAGLLFAGNYSPSLQTAFQSANSIVNQNIPINDAPALWQLRGHKIGNPFLWINNTMVPISDLALFKIAKAGTTTIVDNSLSSQLTFSPNVTIIIDAMVAYPPENYTAMPVHCYLIVNGTKWPMQNSSHFDSFGFDENKAVHASKGYLDSFPDGFYI